MSTRRRRIIGSAYLNLAAAAALALAGCSPVGTEATANGAADGPGAIAVNAAVPTELNPNGGGAPNATLDQAAAFAWQEFIALNWPALTHSTETPLRDTADPGCRFGDTTGRCGGQPLVWQTFRGKAEIFTPTPNTQIYDAPPDYATAYTTNIQACPGVTPPAAPAWVNLDETSEIGLAAMYSGAGLPTPTAENSAPQLIRFVAKANRPEYDYATLLGAHQAVPPALLTATANYVPTNGSPPPNSPNYVSLPNNTIEIKAGWRQLNPQTEDVSHFHTTRVRYYEAQGSGGAQCYREAVWGLVSLHIIQKTQSAPYFIFATFEQADNIRNADGQPTETADGGIIAAQAQPCRQPDQQAPCPTTPTTVYQDSPNPATPPLVSLAPANAAYCTTAGTPADRRLYYLNSADNNRVPNGGNVCINARQHEIPPTIIAANQNAHAAIAAYNQANGIAGSPWSYYKLINVQYVPMALTTPGQPYTGPNPSTFYQSNSVVESNYTLQNFSGRLVGSTGTKTDYASQFGGPANVATAGMYYRPAGAASATAFDMGGCMGCHGTAQRFGSDFSFILLVGAVNHPEAIPQPSANGAVHIDRARVAALWAGGP